MQGIYQKELMQYFKSMIGYLFIAVFLCIAGAVFYTVNLASLSTDIKVFFSNIIPFLIFLMPILTMRIYSEEKKQKTEELLLTSPLEVHQIVLGKFWAAFTVFAMPLVITLAFPVVLSIYGTMELYVTLGNYVGITLIASSFLAIGMFVSVLSENQIIAAILTYSILIATYSVDTLTYFVSNEALLAVIEFVSVNAHYAKLTYGVLNLVDVVYFLSITVLFLYASVLVIERKRVV